MPCNSVIRIRIAASFADLDLLVRALDALGWAPRKAQGEVHFQTTEGVSGVYVAGSLRLTARRGLSTAGVEETIRKSYTRETLMVAARRQGLKVAADTKTPDVFYITTDGRVL